ncbi:MAG: DUF1553 domain-containing protein [Planctomycetaceae bacterium]|nr:DUF1553 domain-containing protein [Planctomycetaceae bacterium]
MCRFLLLAGLASLIAPISVFADEQPVSFTNDVIPVLTKAGCNMGACHAKAGNGQNGFQLSLLGFEPRDDYEHLVKEAKGRRLSYAAPDQSLLLQKASSQIPHGGGLRLKTTSKSYEILREWIRQGARFDREDTPNLVSIEVQPKHATVQQRSRQQLRAIAHYSDGTQRDVTGLALYESNDEAMAEVTKSGLVQIQEITGNVAVMVRYQGQVAVYRASVPLGVPITKMPPPNNFVDEHVLGNLERLGIPPSPLCDDATFLRRVTLDIAGRLPTTGETKAFLASQEKGKRARVIDELLRSPDYADYFASKWAALLKNRRDNNSDIVANFAFHAWVRDSLLANKPFDQFVRELLAATGTVITNPPVAWYKRVTEPKQQIEDVAQLFLGVRMQCAQCHHHPFERWSQDDYYSLSAFFSRVGRKPTATRGEDLIFHQRGVAEAKNVKSGQMLRPAALGDDIGEIPADEDPRLRLVDWMSKPENPFFAKAVVNRYWKHFFGRGLIEPEDDIRDSNPPTNPELLAALEKHFIESGFDLKELVRFITTSNAYQLSSRPNDANLADNQNFSRFYPRRMQAEVLLDSIDDLTGTRTTFANLPSGTRAIALPDNSYNKASEFLRVFGRPDNSSVCECERVQTSSLAQSLHLINSSEVKNKLAAGSGRAATLAKSEAPLEQRVDEIYLMAFARYPTPTEQLAAVTYLQEPVEKSDGTYLPEDQALKQNLQDLIWALANTKEFLFIH